MRNALALATITTLASLILALAPITSPRAGAMPGDDGPPPCDRALMSECTWLAEVDGRSVVLPGCDQEDGNQDGLPCLWFNDSRTWYVTSENYR